MEILHSFIREIVDSALNMGEDHISEKLIKELERKEHYKFYRDLLKKVTVVG